VYDFAGCLIAVRAEKDGMTDEISYTYDSAGRLETVNRGGNAIQYSYDAFLQTGETTPTGTITRELSII
jgi:YD repeat-containing protein